jgi:hypothetical protein
MRPIEIAPPADVCDEEEREEYVFEEAFFYQGKQVEKIRI